MRLWKQAMLLLTGGATYTQKVIALLPIAYWPLAEASGSTATDESGNGRNGTYTAVTLGQTGIGDGRTAASFNGSTSFCNLYSASLSSAFNNQEGTIAVWFQVSAAGVWTDATQRLLYNLSVDSNNGITIRKNTTNNQLRLLYRAGGTLKFVDFTTGGPTAWTHAALTWSKSADQMKAYLSGAQVGTTQTGLGVWSGALSTVNTILGANDTSATNDWSGNLAHAALWTTPLSAAQIATLAVVP